MSSIVNRVALLAGTAVVLVCAWACAATRNPDGSWTMTISPEMSIRAWGLEDALDKLNDMLAQCQAGAYVRPCTTEELNIISQKITEVVQAKMRLGDHPDQGGTVTV